jgi:hypothetical protein
VSLFSRNRNTIKNWGFHHSTQQIPGHQNMLKANWSICWSIKL